MGRPDVIPPLIVLLEGFVLVDLGVRIGVDDDLIVGGFADGAFFVLEEGSEAEVAGGADVVVAAGCDASFLVEVGGVADEAEVVVEAFFFFDEWGFWIGFGWDRFADTVVVVIVVVNIVAISIFVIVVSLSVPVPIATSSISTSTSLLVLVLV